MADIFFITLQQVFFKHIRKSPIGGFISVVRSNILIYFPTNLIVVKLLKLKPYNRYVDDIYSKRIKNQSGKVLEKSCNYQLDKKLAIEVNPSKLLKMEIMVIIETSAVVRESKIINHWSSEVS